MTAELANGGGRLRLVARGDHDAGAGGGEALGHAEPDSPVSAGDDGDLALEIEHWSLRRILPEVV
ncbi:MAG: hypothetical protein DME05_23440 [Candidatus Rokuibacteriota bacterium]|nr:MAG: hypothetical protein DME05_23440 [Candidatus Rokubacteria bacterium]